MKLFHCALIIASFSYAQEASSGHIVIGGASAVYDAKLNGGCVGNGIADDTACLSAAVASAVAGAKAFYVPPGTYRIRATSGTIIACAAVGMECFGAGMGKTILYVDGSVALTGALFVLSANYYANVSIHGFSIIIGSGYSGGNDIYPIVASYGARNARIYDNEISGGYSGSTPGVSSAAISLYEPYNSPEFATTLGTAIDAGVQSVTPASMAGIYVGRRIQIGGASESVLVTATTSTTFTATFAKAHTGADSVIGYSNMRQYALVEGNYIHDVPAHGITPNSAMNIIRRNRIINAGVAAGSHSIYAQSWGNVIEGNYIEYAFGTCINVAGASPTGDNTANRVVNNEVINCGSSAIDVMSQGQNGDGTSPEIPNGVSVNRGAVIQGNLIRRLNGVTTAPGRTGFAALSCAANCQIIGNTLEDAAGDDEAAWISASYSIVSNNTLRVLNGAANSQFGIRVEKSTVADNAIAGWNKGGAAVFGLDQAVVHGNRITVTGTNGYSVCVLLAAAATYSSVSHNYCETTRCGVHPSASAGTNLISENLVNLTVTPSQCIY